MAEPEIIAELVVKEVADKVADKVAERLGGEPVPVSAVPPPNNLPYIIAVVAMMAIAFTAIVVIMMTLPERDNMPLIGVIMGFLAPTTLSLLAFMKSQETHLSVNSRLDGFMRNAELAARAKGRDEGMKVGAREANQRTDELSQLPHYPE